MPKYTTNLSARGFRQLADDIRKYRLELQKKCDEFTRQLAEEGVAIAKANILSEDAIYTGELLNSMNIKPGGMSTINTVLKAGTTASALMKM